MKSEFQSSSNSSETKKIFKCDTCYFLLSSKEKLDKHVLQIHQTVERVECKTCEKTFSSLHVLKAHIKNIHNQIKVECNQCQKVLRCEQSLKAHKLFFSF